MSTIADVVISPPTTTRPVVKKVSQATRPWASSSRTASRTVSEIWSAILSGWPSVTDSDVNRKLSIAPRCSGWRQGSGQQKVLVNKIGETSYPILSEQRADRQVTLDGIRPSWCIEKPKDERPDVRSAAAQG